MIIFHFLSSCLFLLVSSYNIIRDLPYNIYHIEDMNQYENKYIPEGNMYYIRFPYNRNNNTKFSMTIPKNTSIFPVYSADFSKYPSDKEIINANFEKELELKNKEDLQYSIYSFDIKNNEPYKVLYFKNNEILNYISFYASSVSNTSDNDTDIVIENMKFDDIHISKELMHNISYFYRVNIGGEGKTLLVLTTVDISFNPNFSMVITEFKKNPTDSELTNLNNYKKKGDPYDSTSDKRNEFRTYKFKSDNKVEYLGILLKPGSDLKKIELYVTVDNSLPTWAIVLLCIGVVIFSFIFAFCCRRSEKCHDACRIIEGCCDLCRHC